MNIPEESIEKAAAAIYELGDEYTPCLIARAALTAAAPTLMAMAWDEGVYAQWENRPVGQRVLEHKNPYRKERP